MRIFPVKMTDCWIDKLKKIAREESVRRKENISVSLLIREVLNKKYKLEDKNV